MLSHQNRTRHAVFVTWLVVHGCYTKSSSETFAIPGLVHELHHGGHVHSFQEVLTIVEKVHPFKRVFFDLYQELPEHAGYQKCWVLPLPFGVANPFPHLFGDLPTLMHISSPQKKNSDFCGEKKRGLFEGDPSIFNHTFSTFCNPNN